MNGAATHVKDEKYFIRMSNIVRRNIIEMLGAGHSGHLGGSMSCADIVTYLYFCKMDITPENFKTYHRDRFIMSKGHSVLAQYGAMVECGFFDREELKKAKTLQGKLQGHPDRNKTPGIEINTGSLGQGLSIGCGIALASKLENITDKNVYVIVGDAELAEGEIWEAAMCAAFYKLDNLVAIVDKNSLSATGFIKELFDIPHLKEKFSSFGWDTDEVDGHDYNDLYRVFNKMENRSKKPKVIIANTVKGRGVQFLENLPTCHGVALNLQQYEELIDHYNKLIEEGC